MRRMLMFVAALVVAGLMSAAGGRSSNGPQCGDTVTTDVTLTHNLVCAGNGLTFDGAAGESVTIDLNGFTIAGGGVGTGIGTNHLGGSVTVENGTIRQFDTGIGAFGAAFDVENVSLVHNGTFGFRCASGFPVTINASTIQNNLGDGASFFLCQAHVTGNTIRYNGGDGVSSAQDSLRLLQDNLIAHNGEDGAFIDRSVSTIDGNTFRFNDATGLEISDDVCSIFAFYVVTNNVAVSNSDGGMSATAPQPCGDVVPGSAGNGAKGNVPFQCFQIVCARLP
jgi:hypothetical protein